jgi:hypothetical protein
MQELPLFAPPQMPAATSNPSVSPARRIEHQRPSLPYVPAGQNPFTNPRPMQSPRGFPTNGHVGMFATPTIDGRRRRTASSFSASGLGVSGSGILPTPDPTVGSCVSEEDKDVALQLMRLGDMSNVSHGRTSASTLDDTFSGKGEAASSTGATSDSDSDDADDLPQARRRKLDAAGSVGSVFQTTDAHFMPPPESAEVSGDDRDYRDSIMGRANYNFPTKEIQAPAAPRAALPKGAKSARPANGTKSKKTPAAANGAMSPISMPPSRKQSITSVGNAQQNGDDEPDLSSKPRCQRCRKSKKGCDRQRPCGRCRDAGLTADQCISEDEGNGRKGRYGRHMGVPIKKDDVAVAPPLSLLPAAPITTAVLPVPLQADKSKKRKR